MKWLLLFFITLSSAIADNNNFVWELSPMDNTPHAYGYWGWGPGVVVYPGYSYGYSFDRYFTYRPLPFAAISYSRSADKFGYSWGDWDRGSAESRSLWACGQADCVSVVWVQGGCAATATRIADQRLGWGYAVDLYRAKMNAMRACRSGATGPCEIRAWACAD